MDCPTKKEQHAYHSHYQKKLKGARLSQNEHQLREDGHANIREARLQLNAQHFV